MNFILHSRLAAETAFVADWDLSRVLLMNDKRFPWIVLVPRRADASEIFDLEASARILLISEIARASERLKAWAEVRGGCNKINVGSLGNMVPQLHVHVVARSKADSAWPGPVWGAGQPVPYDAAELSQVAAELSGVL
jgi:diadenosine tetraphosphate (Ap4A) HIT family hydrolase